MIGCEWDGSLFGIKFSIRFFRASFGESLNYEKFGFESDVSLPRGMLGQLLRPFVSSLTGRFFSSQPSISSSDSPKRDGKFIEKLREWSKGLAGGVEANVALAK